MAKKKEGQGGIRSAVELAMERSAREGGPPVTLSDEQKAALAQIDRETQAKIAELEIMEGQKAAEARGRGDAEQAAQIEEGKAKETARLRRLAEKRKDGIRRGEEAG